MIHVALVSPSWPFPPATGGARAAANHWRILRDDARFRVRGFFLADGAPGLLPEDAAAIPRAVGKLGDGWAEKLRYARQLLGSPLPRRLALCDTRWLIARLEALHRAGELDVVVVDDFGAAKLLFDWSPPCPVVYVAHNCEAAFFRDVVHGQAWPGKAVWAVEAWKAARTERRLLAKVEHTIFISPADPPLLGPALGAHTVCTEYFPLRPDVWTYRGGKRLLFVGSADFPPNREALAWLAGDFARHLAQACPDAVIEVAGTDAANLPERLRAPNLNYLGFVSAERLDALHRECDLFVSPVVLGAGIKIKVLDALSYAMPVVATPESLAGVDFVPDLPRLDRADPKAAAAAVAALLADPQRLNAESARIRAALTAHAATSFGDVLARVSRSGRGRAATGRAADCAPVPCPPASPPRCAAPHADAS